MKKIGKVLGLVIISTILFTACGNEAKQKTATKEGGIKWVYSMDEALKLSKQSGKPIMVDFYADWCGWCKKLDKDTYADAKVVDLSEKFINTKINTDNDKFNAHKYKIRGLPTILFLDSDGQVLQRIGGYVGPEGMIKVMEAISK